MEETYELNVGSKGELYTSARLRKKTGLKPGGKVLATVTENKIVLRIKPSAADLLKKPRLPAKPITTSELSKLRKRLARELGER